MQSHSEKTSDQNEKAAAALFELSRDAAKASWLVGDALERKLLALLTACVTLATASIGAFAAVTWGQNTFPKALTPSVAALTLCFTSASAFAVAGLWPRPWTVYGLRASSGATNDILSAPSAEALNALAWTQDDVFANHQEPAKKLSFLLKCTMVSMVGAVPFALIVFFLFSRPPLIFLL